MAERRNPYHQHPRPQYAKRRTNPPEPPPKTRRKHDEVLKAFFAHPLAARSLVQDFMARDWHHQLDLDSLHELPTEHVSPNGPNLRRLDAAWWVPFHDHRRAVVFHIEYQSAVAHDMILRNLEYVANLYRFLKNSARWKNPDGTLPAVLSNVLHVGPEPWAPPTSLAKLAPPGSPQAAQRQTVHLHGLLDSMSTPVQDLPPDDTLLRWLVDLVRDWRNLEPVTDALAARYAGPEHAGVREGYATWAEEATRAMGMAQATIERIVARIRHPEKGGSMFWQAVEAAEELRREGREQGLEQGLADKRALVVRQAGRRFGMDTAERLRRLLAASGPEVVDEAADAVVDCDTGDKLLARAANGAA